MFITVQFTTTDGKQVTATDRMVAAWTSVALIGAGAGISLRYNPENSQKIMIVSERAQRQNEVVGSFQVIEVSNPHPNSVVCSSIRIVGILSARKIARREVVYEGNCPINRWPSSSMALPVMVDKTDPSRFKILWDQVTDQAKESG
ncbi:MAG: hypothetical protein FWG14_11250 [Peptococcaceae bacterium]|nr:hypothetical protein [Peptococcaceae bacterium]